MTLINGVRFGEPEPPFPFPKSRKEEALSLSLSGDDSIQPLNWIGKRGQATTKKRLLFFWDTMGNLCYSCNSTTRYLPYFLHRWQQHKSGGSYS